MSTLITGIIIGIVSIVSVMGLGLAGGIYFYYYFETKTRKQNKFKNEEGNKKAGKKIPTGLRQSDIGSGIKQTKVSVTNVTGSINAKKSNNEVTFND